MLGRAAYLDRTMVFLNDADGRIRPQQTPWLFCNSDHMVAEDNSDYAFDVEGNTYPSTAQETFGQPATIEEHYAEKIASHGAPYWVPAARVYSFARTASMATGYCGPQPGTTQRNFALT
jgi:hypothetical protein